jgi:arylformamidase
MTVLYGGFDQEALDREYSPSAALPGGWAPYLADYASLSRQALAGPGVKAGLRYGESPDAILDLFLPPEPGPWPLHVFIHGGFWQELSQREFGFLGPAFQRRGVAYAAINHTLAPAATIGAMVDQCRAAVAWLYAEAGTLGLDRRRIALSGHSAGAHLCAMLLTTDWPRLGLPADVVKGALLISGVYDLEPIRLSYVNRPLGLSSDDVAAWSPQVLDPRAACPVAVMWGEHDTAEFGRQSAEFADMLAGRGKPVVRRELPALNHFDILFDVLKDPSVLMEMALRHLGSRTG